MGERSGEVRAGGIGVRIQRRIASGEVCEVQGEDTESVKGEVR